ncbi:MAG: hypothetical protein KDC83_15225 [Flavobacteriales bacterium]|nr:hypothetical protein [Flavobacteriales bacterium]
MSVRVNGKKYKLSANQSVDIPINEEKIELIFGKYLWQKKLNLEILKSADLFIVSRFNSREFNPLTHFTAPSQYIEIDQVNETEYNTIMKENSDLSYVKKSMINFIDVATLFIGCLVGFMSLAMARKATLYEYLIIGVTACAIIFSLLIKRLSFGAITQEGMLFRNAILSLIALLWYLQNFEIAGLVILGISIIGFSFMWKMTKNSILIQ